MLNRHPAKLLVFWEKMIHAQLLNIADDAWRVFIFVNRKRSTIAFGYLSLKFIEVRIFCYRMPVIGKNIISWFYAYVEHSEIKAKTVNIIHFPYLDLSQNVKIRVIVPYSLRSPRNSECKLAHIYGMNKGKICMSCVLYTNRYANVNEWMLFQF